MFAEAAFVLVIALLVGSLFAFGFGRTGPWPGLLWFFLLLFFGTWGFGIWLEPLGPALWGVYWLSFLFVAIGIALLVAAVGPPADQRSGSHRESDARDTAVRSEKRETEKPDGGELERTAVTAASAVGLFFWLLLAAAVVAVIAHYIARGA